MNIQIADPALLIAVTARILAALMVAPLFGHRSVPMMVRLVLAVSCAWILVSLGTVKGKAPESLSLFLLGLIFETMVGLLLGFVASLAFWMLTMSGELIGLQIGWNMGATMHITSEQSSAPTGQFFAVMGMLVFLGIGGHRAALIALSQTFVVAPPFSLTGEAIGIQYVTGLGQALFTGALQLALPAMGTLILVEVTLAFLSRALPSLNAWVFGLPLKIAAGLLAIWVSLPVLILMIERWFGSGPLSLQGVIK